MKLEGSIAIACSNSVSASCSLPLFCQQLSLMNVRGRRQKSHPLERCAISDVGGLEFVGLMIEVVSRLVVLPDLGVETLLVESLGFVGGDCGQCAEDQQQGQDTGKPFHQVP